MSFPETIQALAFNKTGGVEELEKLTLPFPEHVPGTIIVKVCLRCLSFSVFLDSLLLLDGMVWCK